MAQTAIEILMLKLTDAFMEEAAFLRGVPVQIEWIKTELRRMKCFLADAEAKGAAGDERVKNWVREIRDVAYQAEDIIDIIGFKIEWRKQTNGGCIVGYSRCVANPVPKVLLTNHKIGSEIESVKNKIEDIAKSRDRYGIRNLGFEGTDNDFNGLVEVHRRGEEIEIIGFEKEKQKLIEQLLDFKIKRLSAVTIVGMGGLGKTTLARTIYRSHLVMKHFDVLAFVSVSQTLRSAILIKEIVRQVMMINSETLSKKSKGGRRGGQRKKNAKENEITKDELDILPEDDVKAKLRNFLCRRRYLIVLDDIWEGEDWYRLKDAFPDVSNGSRLLITTRNLDVAEYAYRFIPPHQLQNLGDEESWELFQKKAFPVERCCPKHLENLARKLSRRCRGLPLALVVLGGLCSRLPHTHNSWLEVEKRMDWESRRDTSVCLDILALSYHHLPHQNLRSCFRYIGLFLEDKPITTSQLIRLWIAEGYIPRKHKQTLEETARDYLNELVRRSMVQIVERSTASGKIKSIYIHDLLRDLCIREARKDGFMSGSRAEPNASVFVEDTVVYHTVFRNSIPEPLQSAQKLHTLLCFELLELIRFNSFKLLRVIDVEMSINSRNFNFPKGIGSLIHLRYLRFRFSGINLGNRVHECNRLPSDMGNLYNLQTLDLATTIVRECPKELWKIPSLRHVFFQEARGPTKIPALKHLHTLCHVTAGRWIKTGFPNSSSLKKLGISDIRSADIVPLIDAMEKLDDLVSLSLKTGFLYKIDSTKIFEALRSRSQLRTLKLRGKIEGFPATSDAFAPSLTKLILWRLELKQDPLPVIEGLPNLTHLELRYKSYCGRQMACSVHGFPQLQFLMLQRLFDLEYWIVERGAMPVLRRLVMQRCYNLKAVPDGFQCMNLLEELKLEWMYEDFTSRVCEGGEDWHKVQHIPSIISSSLAR